jgi:hypothetical protein
MPRPRLGTVNLYSGLDGGGKSGWNAPTPNNAQLRHDGSDPGRAVQIRRFHREREHACLRQHHVWGSGDSGTCFHQSPVYRFGGSLVRRSEEHRRTGNATLGIKPILAGRSRFRWAAQTHFVLLRPNDPSIRIDIHPPLVGLRRAARRPRRGSATWRPCSGSEMRVPLEAGRDSLGLSRNNDARQILMKPTYSCF